MDTDAAVRYALVGAALALLLCVLAAAAVAHKRKRRIHPLQLELEDVKVLRDRAEEEKRVAAREAEAAQLEAQAAARLADQAQLQAQATRMELSTVRRLPKPPPTYTDMVSRTTKPLVVLGVPPHLQALGVTAFAGDARAVAVELQEASLRHAKEREELMLARAEAEASAAAARAEADAAKAEAAGAKAELAAVRGAAEVAVAARVQGEVEKAREAQAKAEAEAAAARADAAAARAEAGLVRSSSGAGAGGAGNGGVAVGELEANKRAAQAEEEAKAAKAARATAEEELKAARAEVESLRQQLATSASGGRKATSPTQAAAGGGRPGGGGGGAGTGVRDAQSAAAGPSAALEVAADPLSVGALLQAGRKGEVPLALAAECALASTKAVYANQETEGRLGRMVKEALSAYGKTMYRHHNDNAKEWAKQLEGVGVEAKRLKNEAPAANEAAMDKLMPLVAQAQHKYDAAFAAVQAKEQAHLETINELCEAINDENKDKAPPRQTPTPAAIKAIPIEGAGDPRHLGFLLRLYEDAAKAKPIEAAEAALGALVPAVALVKAAPLKGMERAVAKTLEENEGDFSRLQDLARLSIECKTAEGAAQAIAALNDSSQLRLTRAKDRLSGLDYSFDAAAIGGYRDVMLNALLDGHLVEIQIHLEPFLKVKKSKVGHAIYKYARALHGFDQERIKYNGPLTKEVVERASKGLVRYIDASGTAKPAPEVCELVVPKLLCAGNLLLELNLSQVELGASWAEVFGEAPLRCEMLRVLSLPSCKLRGPLPTLQLPSLQTLWLGSNQLTGGLEPLKGCTALQTLWLGDNQLTGGLEPLKGCTALLSLNLRNNQLRGGLEPLKGCTALRTLWLDSNQLTGGLEPLKGCTKLQELYLEDNQLTGGVEPLKGCTTLQKLFLNDNQLTGGLEPLKGCTALQELRLNDNQLTGGLEPLKGCTVLRTLWLDNNQLTGGLEPLKGRTALRELRLENTQLSITAEDKAHFEKQVETLVC